MKLTKGQKIWIGLLGVGLGALVVDQAGGQGQAAASVEIESVTVPVDGPAQAARAESGTPNIHQQLAARLSALAQAADPFAAVRDAFQSNTPEEAAAAPAPAAEAPDLAVASFVGAHTLKAVLRSGGRQQAWVNERIVEVGQTIGGARLVAAEGMSATFDLNGARVDLVLPDARAMARVYSVAKTLNNN